MFELDKYENLLPPISNYDFQKAQENLMKNMKQKSFYREKQFVVYENESISSDFSGENLRRSYYVDSEIRKANLTNVGFSGSIFISTDFYDCIINNTKLDFCEFDNCNFINSTNSELLYLNFVESIICNSKFENLDMHAANFTNAIFENVLFKNCNWKSLCLEGTVFKNTILDNVNLQKLNFEFSYFDNIKMNNVRLPFPTIPYIFNGLQYLMHTQDSIKISSAASKTGSITVDEYLNNIDDLIVFYTRTQNYFPLANILISQDKYDQAYAAILSGIKFSMMHVRNFRLVYYYSKLLQITEHFTLAQRADVYDMIIKHSNLTNWRPLDYYNFNRYIDRIRNTLLNEMRNDFLTITLNTNILCKEYSKISCLYQALENTIRLVEKDKKKKIIHYIEIRHNSPHEFFLKAFSDPAVLSLLLDAISLVCMGIGNLINQHQEKKSEKLEKEKISILQNIENDLKSEQLNYYKQQNQQLMIQNALLNQKLEELNTDIRNNNIVINNINYHITKNEFNM